MKYIAICDIQTLNDDVLIKDTVISLMYFDDKVLKFKTESDIYYSLPRIEYNITNVKGLKYLGCITRERNYNECVFRY